MGFNPYLANVENFTNIEKEETHAHRKRPRSTLSCDSDTQQFGSGRSVSTVVVKVNCPKTRPYCTCNAVPQDVSEERFRIQLNLLIFYFQFNTREEGNRFL